MALKESNCPHVLDIGDNSWEDVNKKKANAQCETCGVRGANLWLCLINDCLYLGCGENREDHSGEHTEKTRHSLSLNLSTNRIWCSACECEVYKDSNNPQVLMREDRGYCSVRKGPEEPNGSPRSRTPADSSSEEDEEEEKPRGLTGLQNLGNTCYMNAALQTLSNCPPIMRFFLDCDGFVRPENKPYLSRSYTRLVQELWHKKRPAYVVPTSFLKGVQAVHPMFRGFSQQDTQEFLRCFMDRIHEEMKEPVMTHHTEHRQIYFSQNEVEPRQKLYDNGDSGMSSQNQSDSGSCVNPEQISEKGLEVRLQRSASDVAALPSHQTAEDSPCLTPRPSLDSGCPPSLASRPSGEATAQAPNTPKSDATYVEISIGQTPTTHTEAKSLRQTRSATWSSPGQLEDSMATMTLSQSRTRISESGEGVYGKPETLPSGIQAAAPKKPKDYHSIITDVFDGRILSSVQCLTCERVSSTKETYQDLSLPIPTKEQLSLLRSSHGLGLLAGYKSPCPEVVHNPGWIRWFVDWLKSFFWGPHITLKDCLAAFFSADDLKGDNMYSCDKCKKLRNGSKFSKVLKLPEILCIHLKRFRHEFMFSTKVGTYVSFPVEGLDMKPYLHKDCKDQVTVYNLVGVICHHGTAGGGHYTSCALNHLSNQWYEFDDQYVTEVSVQQVESCEAYVLFYRKNQEEMTAIRHKAHRLQEEDVQPKSFMQFWISRQWINRFNTFSEPGPITNSDLVCYHGGVHPKKWSYIEDLVWKIPQSLWEFFHHNYGGGPVVTSLFQCSACKEELERLQQRQDFENETFARLHKEFHQAPSHYSAVYAISISWFREWEEFARKLTDELPGPIDNRGICRVKNNTVVIEPNSDYGQVSEEAWQFLYSRYGGGPAVMLSPRTFTSSTGDGPLQDSADF